MGTYENREEFPKTLILKSLTPAPRVTGPEIPAQASMVTSNLWCSHTDGERPEG